jgi:peptidyl-prolyl cis-trans isomerase D
MSLAQGNVVAGRWGAPYHAELTITARYTTVLPMLNAIRKRSGSIAVKILLALLILSFGLWGVTDVFFQQAQRATVVVVGEKEILGAEVEQAVRSEVARIQRLSSSQFDIAQARSMGVIDSVVEKIIVRTLYSQAANDLGLMVSDPLIRDAISNNPNFRGPTGRFDNFTYRQVLQNNDVNESLYVAQLRGDLARAQLLTSVTAGANASKTMAEAMYRYANERRIAESVFIRDSDMKTLIDPGDAILQAFRDENRAQFTAPEQRKVTAVVLTAADLAKEIAVPEDELQEEFENRRLEFVIPELRNIRQMVMATKEEADKAYGMLREGISFAKVANDLVGLDETLLNLGEMTRDQMLPEMADAAFALEKDKFSEAVESPLGWHIIEVTDIKAGSEPAFADIRDRLIADYAYDKAIDSLFDLSNKLEDALGGGASLEEASQQMNVPLLNINSVDATGRDADGIAVPNLPKTNRFLDVTFQTRQGEESQLEEGGTDIYFVLRVDSVTAPALRPFGTVRADVLSAWQADQRGQAAEASGNALLESLMSTGGQLETVAKEAGLSVETTLPLRRRVDSDGPPQILRDMLFATEKNAFTVGRGNGGFYVAQTKDILPADPFREKTELSKLSQRLADSFRADIAQQFANALRNDHPVIINDSILDELF